jgi:hypothetical protein
MSDPRTSETFAIGEVAVLCNLTILTHRNGLEVEIIGGLENRPAIRTNGDHVVILGYEVRDPTGEITITAPHRLRKKRPPRNDLQVVRWDQCPWQPETINV